MKNAKLNGFAAVKKILLLFHFYTSMLLSAGTSVLFSASASILLSTGLLSLNFGLWKCSAQDIHFSQFYQTPLLVNPSLTGVFNGDMRAGINYKDQWKSIQGNVPAYRTYSLSFDAGLFKKKWANSYLGAGINVFSDKAGDTKMGTTHADLLLSSILVIADGHQVSLGVQGGYAQRYANLNNPDLRWETQFQNEVYLQNVASGEPISYEPFTFADFSAGASWNYGSEETSIFKNNRFRANAGFAWHHLNKPAQQFYRSEKLNSKIVAHGGMYFGLSNSNMAVLPSVIYLQQGPAREINGGAFLRYTLTESSKYTGIMKESAFYLGGYYRLGDAFIPSVMIEFENYALGLTYDVNISKLRAATNAKGGVEISLRFSTPNPFTYKYGKARSKSVRFL